MTFPYISKYLEGLPKSNGKQRLVILRCVSTLMGDLHRLLTNNNSSISSIGIIKKRFNTHIAPTTFQTQQIHDDNEDEIDENNDDKLDFITYEYFEIFFSQILSTMKYIHMFMGTTISTQNDDTNQSMDTDDDMTSNLIDRDQSRDLASRAFYYALDSFYFLLSLFKVKQSNWQKELDKDSTCLSQLLKLIENHILITKKPADKQEENDNERTRILKIFFSFADILNLIDTTRLCQSLELFIQLFEEETHQVYKNYQLFSISMYFFFRMNFTKFLLLNVENF